MTDRPTAPGGESASGPPVVAILTGHVERVALFRELLDDVEDDREGDLPTLTGRHRGSEVIVVGTGMGGPATVAGLRKVRSRRASVVVRAGGAGPVAPEVTTGHFIVATAAVRDEGASAAFLPIASPAVSDPLVVECLRTASEQTGAVVHTGVVHSKDSFFASEVDIQASPVAELSQQRWAAWQALGVLASDMEVATLLTAAERYGLRAGAVLRINHLVAESGGLRPIERELCSVAVTGAVTAALVTATPPRAV